MGEIEIKVVPSAADENKIILREYKALLRVLKNDLKKGDKKLIRRAFEISLDAHKHMRRKSGEPYILHPLAVAKIVVEEIGLGVTSAICALLHDVVEDTEITLNEIESEFGIVYAKIIDGLTKIANFSGLDTNTTEQAENFRKILLTLADDPRVILIKLADRLHNMRTLGSMTKAKQLKISSETSYIYSPLAHRLGLYEIRSEYEDLALKYTQPEVYEDIEKKLKETQKERNKYINDFIKPIKEELIKEGFNMEIYGRSKSIHSIWRKMQNKHVSFEEVFDLFAIRIILEATPENEKNECWKAYSIITNFYKPSPERLRDWISAPKGNGYEALHTTVMGADGVWVEVQIRSKRMNEIAEKGLAAHWKYKEGTSSNQNNKLDDFLQHISEVLSHSDADTLDFLQDFKLDLFIEEIYVYTPKGQTRVLPKGATALDFAFDIHSQLGEHCIGAKVNHKLVPISHVLKNGDQVEIITSSKQLPNEDWLLFVITGKAKSRIKYYLKEEQRRIGDDGKSQLERKLSRHDLTLNNYNVEEICHFYKVPTPLDLYYGLAVGNLNIKELNNFSKNGDKIVFNNPEEKQVKSKEEASTSTHSKIDKKTELLIFGEKSDKIKYKLAQCCQPIPGDDVFGFVTAGEGLKIHRSNCPNAAQLLAHYSHRVVKTKWAKNKEISFLSGIKIIGLDDAGVILKITSIISGELQINMRSISIDSKDGLFEGNIKIFVHDRDELDLLCDKLIALEGITTVERYDEEKT